MKYGLWKMCYTKMGLDNILLNSVFSEGGHELIGAAHQNWRWLLVGFNGLNDISIGSRPYIKSGDQTKIFYADFCFLKRALFGILSNCPYSRFQAQKCAPSLTVLRAKHFVKTTLRVPLAARSFPLFAYSTAHFLAPSCYDTHRRSH